MNPNDFDCIVIGAGAAGLAAARQLRDTCPPNFRICIVEARTRIGGRTWTDTSNSQVPLELGAEFIHGRGAETHKLLEEAGMKTVPAERYERLKWAAAKDNETGPIPIEQLQEPLKNTWKRVKKAHVSLLDNEPVPDASLATFLASSLGETWNSDLENMADVLLAQTCCAPLSDLSCADLAREMRVDTAGTGEFRLENGYSELWNWYSRGVDIRLGQPVLEIHWDDGKSGSRTGIKTTEGFLAARTIIVTIPVAVLNNPTAPRFVPELPLRKRDAIAAFKTLGATKLIYTFQTRFWDLAESYVCGPGTAARWWFPAEGRGENGPGIISCFLTAQRAAVVDALESDEQARDLGLADLASLFALPVSTLLSNLGSFKRVSWINDPWALGGYAYIPTGAAWAREKLAEPVAGKLFFAGEATAREGNPQTVHGALVSGWRAAREVLGF